MKLQKVSCNKCGNLLEISHSTQYVTCGSCHSALEVVVTGNSYFTKEHQENISAQKTNLKILKSRTSDTQVYAEIEMLDRSWNNNLPNFMVKGTLPDTDGGLKSFMEIFGIIFGVIWTLVAGLMFLPFALFGVVFIIVGIWNLHNQGNRRKKFIIAKNEYEQKRAALQMKLQQRNYD